MEHGNIKFKDAMIKGRLPYWYQMPHGPPPNRFSCYTTGRQIYKQLAARVSPPWCRIPRGLTTLMSLILLIITEEIIVVSVQECAQNVSSSLMVPYGPIWCHLVPYGPIWSHMVPYGPKWSQMVQ